VLIILIIKNNVVSVFLQLIELMELIKNNKAKAKSYPHNRPWRPIRL
jgi:hypothetical protein